MARVLLTVLAALLIASPASAQRCDAPAGTSGVDQYCEVVPSSKGDQDAGPEGAPGISNSTTATLTDQGSDGEALARVLGGDPAATPASKGSRPPAAAGQVTVPDAPSSNPFSAVTEAVGGNTTLGSAFFMALFGIVVLMLGLAWVGWRRGREA